jgi:DNA-binding NtrC family response regulator
MRHQQKSAHQIKAGKMREDFFYRIHVIPINLPALRERKEDIPFLVEHFLNFTPMKRAKADWRAGHGTVDQL